jgi:hypothetical protein
MVYRKHRRPLAGCLILLLLSMQAAVAAYTCPQLDAAPAAHAAMPDCGASGGGLPVMDTEQPLLCLADCEQEARLRGPAAAPEAAPATGLLCVVAIAPARVAAASPLPLFTDPTARGDPPPGWPPPYLLHRVLRN